MKWIVLCAAASLLIAAAAQHQPAARVGIVDLNKVFEGYGRKDALQAELKKLKDKYNEQLTAIDAKRKPLEAEVELLEKDTARRQELEREVYRLVQDQHFERRRFEEAFQAAKLGFHNQLLDEIRAVIAEYGRSEGFTVILQREFTLATESLSWQSVLYHAEETDVTPLILARLNAPK
ncbi:MAG: OmpH family outer membrane protein [Planctomycetes bacterium]|nr:OmpH family outer membrane protein [Planctomycetota bacterium]